jgi:hypothetical protein
MWSAGQAGHTGEQRRRRGSVDDQSCDVGLLQGDVKAKHDLSKNRHSRFLLFHIPPRRFNGRCDSLRERPVNPLNSAGTTGALHWGRPAFAAASRVIRSSEGSNASRIHGVVARSPGPSCVNCRAPLFPPTICSHSWSLPRREEGVGISWLQTAPTVAPPMAQIRRGGNLRFHGQALFTKAHAGYGQYCSGQIQPEDMGVAWNCVRGGVLIRPDLRRRYKAILRRVCHCRMRQSESRGQIMCNANGPRRFA